jgi:hypothetical protein
VWGERSLGIVTDDAGTSRVRFCQRPDRLFTYYVEARRESAVDGRSPSDGLRWTLVRDGGLFADELAMRRDARAGLSWQNLEAGVFPP